MDKLTNAQLIEISIAIGGGVIFGWLIKKLIVPLLLRITRRTKWKSDDLVVESVAGWVVFWFFLGGCLYVLPIFSEASGFIARNESFFHNIIGALFIFSFTWVIARIAGGLLEIRSSRDDSILPSTSILSNIAKGIIYVIGFILILQTFGVAIAPLVTALGVGGIAVALALQPTLSNLFSGLQIIASGKINVGDFIQLENGQRGIITDITWRNTVIRTAQNNLVILPNSKMSDSIIENFYLDDKKMLFNVEVGVSYDSDLQKVEAVAIDVAKKVLAEAEGATRDFEPFIRFYQFGESAIGVRIFLRADEFGFQFPITSVFIKALHRRFKEEGINIPFPIRTVYLKNEN